MKNLARLTAVALLVSSLTAAQTSAAPLAAPKPSETNPALGRWDAALTVERKDGSAYVVAFGFRVDRSAKSGLQAMLVNGSDVKPFTRAEWKESALALFIGEYEGELTLKCDSPKCTVLAGEYTRLTRMGQMHYKVTAKRSSGSHGHGSPRWDGPSLDGDWVISMWGSDATKKEVAPMRFKLAAIVPNASAAEFEGTVAAVSGDYGNMHGVLISERGSLPSFRLSRFDGNHTNLMEGTIEADGSLKGTIAFSPLSTVHFTAVRKGGETAAQKAGEEAESLTKMRVPAQVFHFADEDPRTGKVVTEADFKGKALIVDIFGTWCPNCHDEAPLLADVYSRYHAQGLEMVGLSFEYTADKQRNTRLVEFFRKKYGIDYALLLGGSTEEANQKLTQLKGFGVYPTTIFIDRAGKVRAIHAGFEGKATGQLEEVKNRFEELVKEIVK